MHDSRPIGVLDSGVGGLTVAKELREELSHENIIYFGDNANVPYGNKTEEEIYILTKKMIDFLVSKNVKLIAIACNTISSILDKYFAEYKIPIISIIKPAVDYAADNRLEKVGVLATNFTIESGAYETLLKERDTNIKVVSEPCPTLATLVDSGDYTEEEMEETIDIHMSNVLQNDNLKDIILGCTHYPIVLDKFQNRSPEINFINPAYEQTMYIKNLLNENNLEGDSWESRLEIYTTGNAETYINMIELLDVATPYNINVIDVL